MALSLQPRPALGPVVHDFLVDDVLVASTSAVVPILTLFEIEDRLHLEKTQIKFGFSLDLHYLCIVILKRVTRKGALSCA